MHFASYKVRAHRCLEIGKGTINARARACIDLGVDTRDEIVREARRQLEDISQRKSRVRTERSVCVNLPSLIPRHLILEKPGRESGDLP